MLKPLCQRYYKSFGIWRKNCSLSNLMMLNSIFVFYIIFIYFYYYFYSFEIWPPPRDLSIACLFLLWTPRKYPVKKAPGAAKVPATQQTVSRIFFWGAQRQCPVLPLLTIFILDYIRNFKIYIHKFLFIKIFFIRITRL